MSNETPVRDLLADADGIGAAPVGRLEARGYETAAKLSEAEYEELVAIPYVSGGRAAKLQTLAAEAHADPREVVLDAELGDRLSIELAERKGWKTPRTVIATEEAVEWHTAAGGTWQTRRIRIADSPTADNRSEWQLVAGADSVYVTDGTAGDEQWPVAFVDHVGTVQNSTLVQLQVEQGEVDGEPDRPEGDDTWRQYQRGEA